MGLLFISISLTRVIFGNGGYLVFTDILTMGIDFVIFEKIKSSYNIAVAETSSLLFPILNALMLGSKKLISIVLK